MRNQELAPVFETNNRKQRLPNDLGVGGGEGSFMV